MDTSQAGFTLLELMVALCIFAIIGTSSYFMLDGLFAAESRVEDSSENLEGLQRWLMISERDMMQLAPAVFATPTDTAPDAKDPALSYNANPLRLSFTRRGWSNPLGYKRSELQRVEYTLDQGWLVRRSMPMLPLANGTGKEKRPLLAHVHSIAAQFMNQNGASQGAWSPPPEHLAALPHAVEFSVNIEGIGTIRQLFPVAGPADAKSTKP